MVKRFITKKILITSAALFALLMIYAIPKKDNLDISNKIEQKLEYVDSNTERSTIYLLDNLNYLAKTEVVTNNVSVEKKARELLEVLIKGGSGEEKIPSGFRSILPSDTRILSLKVEEGIAKINFSKELLDVAAEFEEKLVEAIIYTLTSIEEIKNIILYVEGDILTKLPQTGVNLPGLLNRNFGINKEYDITTYKDINKVVIYYLNKYNDKTYYVPVTKYLNDDREKIEIIVDSLSGNHGYNTNLKSYLNTNAKLLAFEHKDNSMDLVFNNYIFNSDVDRKILEEVIYTISLSVKENYDIVNLTFNAQDEKIYEKSLKSLD